MMDCCPRRGSQHESTQARYADRQDNDLSRRIYRLLVCITALFEHHGGITPRFGAPTFLLTLPHCLHMMVGLLMTQPDEVGVPRVAGCWKGSVRAAAADYPMHLL